MKRALLVAVVLASSCRPDLGDRDSLIQRTQILAVRGEPAEVKPGETATYSLLVATRDGPLPTPITSWAFCASPKLLTDNGVTSVACVGQGVRPIAEGPASVSAAIPSDACALFGPEVTSADLRPRDPDVTGGFYQPVRATVLAPSGTEAVVAFGLERLDCKLANASAEATSDYARRHTPNKNPTLGELTASVNGTPVGLDEIPHGGAVVFRATWPDASAEHYVVYDPSTAVVVNHRESMRLSWYATGGVFENDRTGRAEEEEGETFTENVWTAPAEPGSAHLFVVLRDARGGVGFATYDLVVR